MNTLSAFLVLQSVVVGQVCEPSPSHYSAPSYVRIAAPIYTNIFYNGTVHSKQYVDAVWSNGKKMKVPVINGIAPIVDYRYSNSTEIYDFTYDSRNKWSGTSPINYESESSDRTPVSKDDMPKKVPAPSFQDELKVLRAQQKSKEEEYEITIKKLEDNVAKLQSLIQKMDQVPSKPIIPDEKAIVPSPTPGMKKPSEIAPKGT